MGINNPKTWGPYKITKDCSQGICNIYCPQWCYMIFPSPPPVPFSSNNDSGTHLSPLVMVILGIMASALLLVSYYAIISKFCRNTEPGRRQSQEHHAEEIENADGLLLEPWFVASTGLDESVIKSISVCNYRRGDGLIESTDCCVCLGEFEEYETLRLLPKCRHAFHVICIDTWLKSHSNCPLCRASVVSPCVQPIDSFTRQTNDPQNHNSMPENELENDLIVGDDIEASAREVIRTSHIEDQRKDDDSEVSSMRYSIVEIGDGGRVVRRSVSMDHSRPSPVSIADIVGVDEEEGSQMECPLYGYVVSSKVVPAGINMSCSCSASTSGSGGSSSSNRSRMLDSVSSVAAIRRSVSSGRFLFSRNGRGHNAVVPV
ncbi:hypothetical protein Dimus_007865 [Dionaea muscipula]